MHPNLQAIFGGMPDPEYLVARLGWGSFVSRRFRLFYLDTPKAACTALKWILARMEGIEIPREPVADQTQVEMSIHFHSVLSLPSLVDLGREEILEVLHSKDYCRFCVVRNPYTRLASAWNEKIRQCEPGFSPLALAAVEHAAPGSGRSVPDFREFAEWVIETNDKHRADGHWQLQAELLAPKFIRYDRILRFETLGADLAAMFASHPPTSHLDGQRLLAENRFNASLPIDWSALYDERLAGRVHNYYAEDFAAFGYDKESWRELSQRPRPSFSQLEDAALQAIRSRNLVIERHAARWEAINAGDG